MRKIIGGLLVSILALLHFNFFLPSNSFVWVGFFGVWAFMIWKGAKMAKPELKYLQYKSASILSFLLPVSAIIYGSIFTGNAVLSAGTEAEQAGAAIGSAIGSTLIVGLTFVVGLMFGIVFHLMSKKKA